MPTATLAQLLDEVATVIRDVVDSSDFKVQVEPGMVLVPSPPCVDVYPADPSNDPDLAAFGETMGGELLNVRVRVDATDATEGQNLLLSFMDDEDPLSIAAALNTDRTLNGLATSLDVRSRSGYVLFPRLDGEGAHLGCLFGVVVVKARS